MILRVILTLMLLVIVWVAIASHKDHKWLSNLALLVCGFGIVVIWIDKYVIALAQWLGVGRGTDLVLYITWPIMFFCLLMLYLRIRRLEARFTALVRTLASDAAHDRRGLSARQ